MISEELKRENLEGKSIVQLNQLCRDHSVKGVIGRPKRDMIAYMVAFNEGRPVDEVIAEQPQTPPAAGQTGEGESSSGGWVDLSQIQAEESQPEASQPEASQPETQSEESTEENTPETQQAAQAE